MAALILRKPPKTTTHHLVPGEAERLCSAFTVKTRLVEVFRSPGYRPPLLPGVVLELQQAARKPRLQVREIVALLAKEPMLAARLLQLAGSALYGGRPAASLETAVVRLGIQKTADLFLQAALEARIFRAPGYEKEMSTLARHSVLVAEISSRLATIAGLPAENAFTCGLLHDVGMAASLIALADVGRATFRE